MLFRHVSVSLVLAALAFVSNSLVAQADTVDFASLDVLSEQPVETQPELAIAPAQTEQPAQPVQPLMADDSEMLAPLELAPAAQTLELADIQELSARTETQIESVESASSASEEYVEDGSTVLTSAAGLTNQPAVTESQASEGQETNIDPAAEQVAQAVTPGRATRSGSSYIGVGGNIGLGDGDTALGDGSFAVFSKIGLTSVLSVRPAVLFSDDPTILIPVTFDFIPGVTDVTEDLSGELGLRISPYVGGGVAISTGDSDGVDFLLSGGVDVPLTSRFTATAAVNATLFDNTAVGLILGLGYNFSAF